MYTCFYCCLNEVCTATVVVEKTVVVGTTVVVGATVVVVGAIVVVVGKGQQASGHVGRVVVVAAVVGDVSCTAAALKEATHAAKRTTVTLIFLCLCLSPLSLSLDLCMQRLGALSVFCLFIESCLSEG